MHHFLVVLPALAYISLLHLPERHKASELCHYIDHICRHILRNPAILLENPADHEDIHFIRELLLNGKFQGHPVESYLPEIRSRFYALLRYLRSTSKITHFLRYRAFAILIFCVFGRKFIVLPSIISGGWYSPVPRWILLSCDALAVLAFIGCHELIRIKAPKHWLFDHSISSSGKNWCHLLLFSGINREKDPYPSEFEDIYNNHLLSGTDHRTDLCSALNSWTCGQEETTRLRLRQWEEMLPVAEFFCLSFICLMLFSEPICMVIRLYQ